MVKSSGKVMIHLLNRSRYLAFSLLCLTVALAGGEGAKAQNENPTNRSEPTDFAQSEALVLPFTDVPPDHWAYQALLNLAGTYGCVSGYPDGTFRGEAAVTRYEFAAGLDACLGALTGLLEQQGNQQQEVDALIEAMQHSLEELRGLDQEVQQLEAE
jgi:hypothetical protein